MLKSFLYTLYLMKLVYLLLVTTDTIFVDMKKKLKDIDTIPLD